MFYRLINREKKCREGLEIPFQQGRNFKGTYPLKTLDDYFHFYFKIYLFIFCFTLWHGEIFIP